MSKDQRINAVLESGKYIVESDGRIFDTDFRGKGLTHEIAHTLDKNGYALIHLSGVGLCRRSRVVGIALLGMPASIKQINHKNGKKADDRPDNLEWVTAKENIRHAIDTGLRVAAFGEEHYEAKLSEIQVKEIALLLAQGNIPAREIASQYRVGEATIVAIRKGQSWKHLGIGAINAEYKTKTGEVNGNARLKNVDVVEIKRRIVSGEQIQSIARDFCVGWNTIKRIKTGECWGQIPCPA